MAKLEKEADIYCEKTQDGAIELRAIHPDLGHTIGQVIAKKGLKDSFNIEVFHVWNAFRGNKIGTRLLNSTANIARSMGATILEIPARPEPADRVRFESFCQKSGLVAVKEDDGLIHLRKTLLD